MCVPTIINPGYDTRVVIGNQGSDALLDMDPLESGIGPQQVQHTLSCDFLIPLS